MSKLWDSVRGISIRVFSFQILTRDQDLPQYLKNSNHQNTVLCLTRSNREPTRDRLHKNPSSSNLKAIKILFIPPDRPQVARNSHNSQEITLRIIQIFKKETDQWIIPLPSILKSSNIPLLRILLVQDHSSTKGMSKLNQLIRLRRWWPRLLPRRTMRAHLIGKLSREKSRGVACLQRTSTKLRDRGRTSRNNMIHMTRWIMLHLQGCILLSLANSFLGWRGWG